LYEDAIEAADNPIGVDDKVNVFSVAIDTGDGYICGVITDRGNRFTPVGNIAVDEDFLDAVDLDIRLSDIDADARTVYSGAVVADFLPSTNGDVDAAAAMTSLLPNPYTENNPS